MAFVAGPYTLYAMRFILGAAEAGFFPGATWYLTYWLPTQYRAPASSRPSPSPSHSPLSSVRRFLRACSNLKAFSACMAGSGCSSWRGGAHDTAWHRPPVRRSRRSRPKGLACAGAAGMAGRAHGGGGGRAQAGGASLAVAARHQQILPGDGPGLLWRLGHRQRLVGVAAAAPKVVRPVEHADRVHQRHPLRLCDRADGAVGTPLGQHGRAALAHGCSTAARRQRLHRARHDRNRGHTDRDHGHVLSRRRLLLQGTILGARGKAGYRRARWRQALRASTRSRT